MININKVISFLVLSGGIITMIFYIYELRNEYNSGELECYDAYKEKGGFYTKSFNGNGYYYILLEIANIKEYTCNFGIIDDKKNIIQSNY